MLEISAAQRFRQMAPPGAPKAAPVKSADGYSGRVEDIPHKREQNMGPSLLAGLFALGSLVAAVRPAAAAPLPPQAPQQQVQVQTAQPAQPADLASRAVVASRNGQLLGHGRILKVDAYPGVHTESLQQGERAQPRIQGAHNFRQIGETGIYGVGQPTVDGLRQTLREIGGEVFWTTLREEPVVYIDGRSLTLREEAHPFANLESPGLTGEQVEAREEALKGEILAEARRYGGKLLIHDEAPDGSVVTRWVEVNESNIQTPRDVFDGLKREGFDVNYARIPITDEKAPENADFDALVARLRQAGGDASLVFNCHAGRGRTTTGMVIGELFRHGSRSDGVTQGADQFERGEFQVIQRMLEQLGDDSSKTGLDQAIDEAGAVQNLRTAIAKLKRKAAGSSRELAIGKDYLYRYYKLVAFNAYLQEQAPQSFKLNFSEWLQKHPELNITPELIELVYNHTSPASAFA